jgi:hypothetical protein
MLCILASSNGSQILEKVYAPKWVKYCRPSQNNVQNAPICVVGLWVWSIAFGYRSGRRSSAPLEGSGIDSHPAGKWGMGFNRTFSPAYGEITVVGPEITNGAIFSVM